MEAIPFAPALRNNTSLTATMERDLLRWIASRLPRWINADHLTALGLLAQFGAGACYAAARSDRAWLYGTAACIVLNWLGDSLDGTVARVREQQRPRFGFYVDHLVDVLGTTTMMTGMAVSGLVQPVIALGMLIAFLMLSAESYLATYALGRFELSQGPFGPTELRVMLIAGTLWLVRHPWAHLAGHTFRLLDLGGAIGTACMVGLAVWLAARHTAELYRQERIA